MLAAGHDTKPPKQKIALLLPVARKQAIEVYNTFLSLRRRKGNMRVLLRSSLPAVIPRRTKLTNATCSIVVNNYRENQLNSLSLTSS